MAYRDERVSLEDYRRHLEAELAEALRAARETAERAKRVAELKETLSETERRIVQLGGSRRRLPNLDEVRIASPCTADWESMVGDERVRFCGKCQKNVYNLSALTREEAERLLAEKQGGLCARLYERADGTILTEDCPVGARRTRVRRAAAVGIGGGLLAATTLSQVTTVTMGAVDPHRIMGRVRTEEPQSIMGQARTADPLAERVGGAGADGLPADAILVTGFPRQFESALAVAEFQPEGRGQQRLGDGRYTLNAFTVPARTATVVAELRALGLEVSVITGGQSGPDPELHP
jgi:hypothetical protein